jgi:hypothetical protein
MNSKGLINLSLILLASIIIVVGGSVWVDKKVEDINLSAVSGTREWVYNFGTKLVRSLSTTQGTLISNTGATATTTTDALEVMGGATVDQGTTTSWAIDDITGSTQCLQVDTNGTITGTGSTCGGVSGQAWEDTGFTVSTIGPTTTNAGIYVTGSSTIDSTLVINGTTTIDADDNVLVVNTNENRVGILTDTSTSTLQVVGDFHVQDDNGGVGLHWDATNRQVSVGGIAAVPNLFNLVSDTYGETLYVKFTGREDDGTAQAGRIAFDPDTGTLGALSLLGADVGIGTETPTVGFEVTGAGHRGMMFGSTADGFNAFFQWAQNSTALYTMGYRDAGDVFNINVGASFGNDFAIANSGNVGMQTLTPTSTLSVIGSTYFQGNSTSTGEAIVFNNIGGSGGDLKIDANGRIFEGSDVSSAGEQAWEDAGFTVTAITPTTSNAGIFVQGSSTIAADFRVDGNATTTGDLKVNGVVRFSDALTQTMDANSTVTSTTSFIELSSASDIQLVSLPNIATGTQGQILYITNSGSFEIEFQDHGDLSGSGFHAHGGDPVLAPEQIMTMIYEENTPGPGWLIQSHPNLSITGDAETLNVRNVSGSAIASGKVVYATGFTANRTTVDLADADDATLMPAIGITTSVINNNANGVIAISGDFKGVDTSGFTVGDPLYVDTTAGELVNARPSADFIQKFGEVLSSAVNGNILVVGAGRTNDVPWDFTADEINATTTQFDNTTIYQKLSVATTSPSDGWGMAVGTTTIFGNNLFVSGTVNILGAVTLNTALTVPNGGTGATTLTDGGILLGSGAGAITPLGQATNGQLPIGSTGADPVLAAITGTGYLTVTNGAGTIAMSVANTAAWFDFGLTNVLTPTSTGAGILVNAASSTLTNLTISDSLQIPNGTAPTVNAIGELALDQTSNQVLIATSTEASWPGVLRTRQRLFAFAVPSTSDDWINSDGSATTLPWEADGFTVTSVMCSATGTPDTGNLNYTLTLTDTTNHFTAIECGSDAPTAPGTTTATNRTLTAGESFEARYSNKTGTIDKAIISIFGTYTRD